MDKIKTGEMIRKARTEKGYTQTELGALINVTNKAVSRWEKGEAFPDVSVLEQLATVLELKIQDLVTGEENNDIAAAVTEIAREVRIQQREKRLKLGKKLISAAGLLILVLYAIPVFSGRPPHFSVNLPFFFQPVYLLAVVFTALLTKKIELPFSGKRTSWFTWIGIIMGMLMIAVMIFSAIFFPGRNTVFGLKPSVIGPLLNSMFVIPFIVAAIFITIEAITESLHYGFFVLIFDMFLAIFYSSLLYNMESPDGVLKTILCSTPILLGEMIIAIVIVRAFSKNECLV